MTDRAGPRRRWDTDERLTGIADARAFAAAIEELAGLARRPGWVSEEPEAHLMPQLTDGAAGLRVLEHRAGDDGALEVTVEHGADDSRRDIRRRAWALIGTIAEPAASVRESRDGNTVVFEVVTGVPEDDGEFATHGHTLRLRIRPPAR